MDTVKKHRAAKWLNYLLLMINLTALATILYMNRPSSPAKTQRETQLSSIEYLRDRLGLSDKQYQELIKLNEKTFRIYYVDIDLLCEANIELLEEMSKDSSDQAKIDKLTKKIGNLNEMLKKNTVRHFEQVKSICTEEQKYKLVLLFKDIMQLEEQCEICNRKECPRKDRLNNLGKKQE